ncbi:MAG: acetylglutamate kinase, partial [Actinomycetota bacterium]|nr:acetylglutamate kinase [Actinomycetota bacterium]
MPGSRPLVVKLGGTAIAQERGVLGEVAALARERDVVVVHGGGKRLSEWLDRLGVKHRFREGLRVTDEATLEVALAVLRGVVNAEVVAELRRAGADAVGLSGID